MHEAALSEAAAPPPQVVLGLLMRPYSLGHELLLVGEENALCADFGREPNASDLLHAVVVCCQGWDANLGMVRDILLGLKLWIIRRRLKKIPLETEMLKFAAYRRRGMTEFPISEIVDPNAPTSRMPGAPFLLRVQQWLMINLRLSEKEAWDYPFGLAVMRWETFWEEQGGLNIKNAAELEFDRFVQEQEAKEDKCQA